MEGHFSLGEKLLQRMESKGDVTFLVGSEGEEEEIKAFSFLLSTVSKVFDKMFDETWKKEGVIKIPDIKPKIFRHFLKLLLNENIKIKDLDELELSMDEILLMLYTAKKYESDSITSICRTSVESKIVIKNIVFVYETLQNMNEAGLEKTAFDFIIENIKSLMDEDSFLDLSEKSIKAILECECLSIRELTLFKGVNRWAESQCPAKNMKVNGENIRKILGDLLFLIRFHVMTIRDFFKSVQPTGILTVKEINEIARCIAMKGDSSFVNNLQFSLKGRPNVTNESATSDDASATPKLSLEQCFMYTPTQDMTLNNVVVDSICSHRNSGYQYSVKLSIFDGDREILPMITVACSSSRGLTYNLQQSVTLARQKKYCIHYEVKRQGATPLSLVNFSGNTLNIKTFTFCC